MRSIGVSVSSPGMRILAVTRTYRLTGGADRYALALQAELERRGHAVIPFAAHHPQNLPTPWARPTWASAITGRATGCAPWPAR